MRTHTTITALILAAAALPAGGARAQDSAPAPPPTASMPALSPSPAGTASSTGAPLPEPLTLESALQIALSHQRTISIAKSQEQASQARVTQARSSYYPQLAPSYRYSAQRTAYDTGQGTQVGRITQNVASIGLDQLLFDMGKREQNVARSKDAVRSASLNVQDTRQAVILDVTLSWYDLLRSKELVRVAESGVSRAKTTLDATRAFVEAGSSPRKDILQAQADYDNAQVQAIQARNAVRLGETTLKNAMGIRTAQPIVTAGTTVPSPSTTPDTRTADNYIDAAFTNRPDLKRAEVDIRANRRGVKIARIEAGPQIQSTYSAGYRVHPDPGNENTLLTSVSYPLFDAGAARAAVREAKISVQQAEQQLELTRQDVAANVESAFLTREEARTRITAAQTALAASQENYAAASESQREGVGTILDVITAQNQLVTAETNAVQAVYDYYTADARLQRAIGDNEITSLTAKSATEPSSEPARMSATTSATTSAVTSMDESPSKVMQKAARVSEITLSGEGRP